MQQESNRLILLTECPTGKYGYNCQQSCICQNGASCDPVSGACSCAAGWQGVFCEQGRCLHVTASAGRALKDEVKRATFTPI